MTKLILRAVAANTPSNAKLADQTVGQVDTSSDSQQLNVNAQPNTQYRLVDSKTGQVVKKQTVVRKGNALQIEVDGNAVAQIENFFPEAVAEGAAPANSATYLVDTSPSAEASYGVVSPQSTVVDTASGSAVLWSPGMSALPLAEPVAFAPQALTALSGISGASALAVGTSAVAVASFAGDSSDTAGTSANPKVAGSVFAGPVVGQGLVAGLKVQAFDDKGNSLGTADVKADGSYVLVLTNPNYKGVMVLKVFDDPNDSLIPKYTDEATGKEKTFDMPLLAVVNYTGDATTTQTVNITPVTHVAALLAGVTSTSEGVKTPTTAFDKDVVQKSNIQVAQKLALAVDDLTSADVQTSDKDTVNGYGKLLALLSQTELTNDKSTSEVADSIKQAIQHSNLTDFKPLLDNVKNDSAVSIKNVSKEDLSNIIDAILQNVQPKLPQTDPLHTSTDGTKIYVDFGQVLSKNTAETKDFKVTLTTPGSNGDSDITNPAIIDSVSFEDFRLVLNLSPTTKVKAEHQVKVSYTDPTSSDDLFAVQSVGGVDADSFDSVDVKNNVSASPPVIKVNTGQVLSYQENKKTHLDSLGTVELAEGTAEGTQYFFRFSDTKTNFSKDGLYFIDSDGKLFLTSAGLAAKKYSNDFETKFNGGNTLTYDVQAGDVAGNWSASVTITLEIQDDTEPPTLSVPRFFTVTEDVKGELVFDSLTFADDDSTNLTVTLSVADGTIDASTGGNVTVGGSATLRTFTGTVAELNTYFKTPGNITYTSASNANGPPKLTIEVKDDGGLSTTAYSNIKITPVNDAPVRTAGTTVALTVDEDSANTNAVSLGLSAYTYGPGGGSDESGQTLTYKITGIPSSITLWKADGATQVNNNDTLSLAELQGLMYKTVANANNSTPANITWTVTDDGASPQTLTETLSVTVNPVNDAPVRTAGTTVALTVDEDSANSTAVSLGLSAYTYGPGGGSDETSQTLTYKITHLPSSITLWKADGTTQVNNNDTLSLAELQGLMYKTVANANNSTPANITWTVTDDGASPQTLTETLSVTVNPVSDTWSVSNIPTSFSVDEDTSVNIQFTDNLITDVDSTTLTVTLGVTDGTINAMTGGNVTVGGTSNSRTFTGTAADLNAFFKVAGNVTYTGASNVNGARTLTLTVSDGSNPDAATTKTSTIQINAVNDAPTIVQGKGIVNLAAVDEDSTNPAGQTVGDLFKDSFSDAADQVNGGNGNAFKGVAITGNAATVTQGKWEYQTSTGSDWKEVPTSGLSDTTALFLGVNSKLRFVPTANFNGTVGSLTVHLVDDSASGLADILENANFGIGTPGVSCSTDTVTLNTSVNAVNDAPTITSVLPTFTVNEDTAGNLQFTGTPFADVDSTTLTVTLTVVDGTINATTGGNVNVGTSNSRTFTGTAADLNAFFTTAGKITYQGALNVNGTKTLSISVNDGATANNTANGSATINITAVNDAPVRTGTTLAPIVVNEDSTNNTAVSLGLSAYTYGPGGGSDESSQTLTYKITGIPSSITLWKTDGITQVNNNDTLSLTELKGLKYKTVANANNSTPANITWTVTDDGASPQTLTETLSVTVNPVNDAPLLTATPVNSTFTEGVNSTQAAPVNVFSNASVNTIEAGQNITSLSFTVSGLTNGTNDVVVVDGTVLSINAGTTGTTATNGMAYTVSISSGVATITLTKAAGITAQEAQTLINGITYQNTQVDNPTAGNRTFTLTQIKDSGGTTNGGVDTTALNIISTVSVVAVNDAPTLAGTNTPLSYTENDLAKAVNPNITVADSDNPTLASATVSITSGFVASQDSLNFTSNATFGNITGSYNATSGVLTLSSASNTATLAQWQAALRAVTYSNSSENPNTTSRNISFVVNDGTANSSALATTVNITAVNDAPVITGPGPQVGSSGVQFYLPGNAYVLADVDAGNGLMTLSIKVTEGTSTNGLALSYVLSAGVTWLSTGADNTYNFQGTRSNLQNWVKNATFANVTFSSNFSGNANVSMTLNDNGNSGQGGSLTASHNCTVAVSNAPVLLDAYTSPDNTKVVLYFNEQLSSTTALPAAFGISISGGAAVTPTAVTVSGKTVELTLPTTTTFTQADTLSVTYTAPVSNTSTSNAAIQDTLGNDSVPFTVNVVNTKDDKTPPVLQKAELSDDGKSVTLTYDEALAPTTASPGAFSMINGFLPLATPSSVQVVGKNTVAITLASAVTPSSTLTVNYSPPAVSNTINTNAAIQDLGGYDTKSFTGYGVFPAPNLPINQVNSKSFTAAPNRQIDITGLGLSDALVTNTQTMQTVLKVNSGTLQLLVSALTANNLTTAGGTLSAGFFSGTTLTLNGNEANLNTFLSTVGNVKYTAPATYSPSGDVLTMTSSINSTQYTDVDAIAIAPNNNGLGLGLGMMAFRQGQNGSAIGIKANSNLVSVNMFDVVDTSLPAGAPSAADFGNYTITVSALTTGNYFFKTSAPTTAVTSFTLAEVNNNQIGFYYNGGATLPSFTATVTKGTLVSTTASSSMQFLTGANTPDGTGGVLYYGDGSGSGAGGGYRSTNGISGAGDNDSFSGTDFNDVMFGDGSGGGEGVSAGSGGSTGLAGRGGGGNDTLIAGVGNDIIFGDGFAGSEVTYIGPQTGESGGAGGYGGGGAAAVVATSSPHIASIGGGTGGFGLLSYVTPTNPSYKGQSNTIGVATAVGNYASGNAVYFGAPGTGVTANGNSDSPTTASVSAMLSKSVYLKVLADISKTNSTDDRVFTQVMGTGNDSIIAGAGNDWVMGGYGNDTLIGGTGDDVMWGRGGGDHIVNLAVTNGSTTVTETTDVYFTDGLKIGESVTVGGLTLTASSAMTAAQIISAYTGLAAGATTGNTVSGATYTPSGSLTGWSSGPSSSVGTNTVVTFTSTTPNSNVPNLTASYKLLDNDIFKWSASDAGTGATDIIKDFSAWNGTSGDKLDILNLLTGYTSGTSTLAQWVTVTTGQTAPGTSTANSTRLVIDVDGSGSGTVSQTIWLEGVTLGTTIVDTLKTNGVLVA